MSFPTAIEKNKKPVKFHRYPCSNQPHNSVLCFCCSDPFRAATGGRRASGGEWHHKVSGRLELPPPAHRSCSPRSAHPRCSPWPLHPSCSNRPPHPSSSPRLPYLNFSTPRPHRSPTPPLVLRHGLASVDPVFLCSTAYHALPPWPHGQIRLRRRTSLHRREGTGIGAKVQLLPRRGTL